MFTRQKTILELLTQAERPLGRLELTKLAFLLRFEKPSAGGSAFFDFVPYHYGPFSFSLYQELGKLEVQGYISSVDDSWTLGEVPPPPLTDSQTRSDIAGLLRRFSSVSTDELVDYVYAKYPRYTVNSKRKKLAKKVIAKPAVYTAGYEGLSVDGFLNRLVESGITQLLDVRMNPIARRYGFHKSTLGKLSANLGISYVHVPELGIRSELRQSLENQSDYDRLFKLYKESTLAQELEAIERLSELIQKQPSVLVCMEEKPSCCHRSHLAEAVSKLTNLAVVHLGQENCGAN